MVSVLRPLAARRAQYKVGVREFPPGNGDFSKPFVFGQTASAPGKPRHLCPTSPSGSRYVDRIRESIRLEKTSKLTQSNL